jgi:alpha-mannosidase
VVPLSVRIETFQSSLRLDLRPLWQGRQPDGDWGKRHRPDWDRRGLLIWPRGGVVQRWQLELVCPPDWRPLAAAAQARLVLRWWAESVELWVDGVLAHQGDLFDAACRWSLPERWWCGEPLLLELRLRSPKHDDGALVHSSIELEPLDPADPHGLLQPTWQALAALRTEHQAEHPGPEAALHVLGHAHLDLAWLWPVADTWQAAERTFASALDLMERFGALHFAHSTPALYAWLQQHRPALFARIAAAVAAGRFEPINGPWVETDCVLISTASLLRQFQQGQQWSRQAFAQLDHALAWLPDSFGFGAGLPAIAQATGVRWFCTHKLAWNATNPFPHRLFRWRGRCGSEVLALMTAPIGTDGDPLAMERYRLQWQQATGLGEALWLPGVGDHGGGPTAEMLEQLALWQQQSDRGAPLAPQRHGSLRAYLQQLEPQAPGLPIWRDELYLELHRGCATSRPDQKRHNRSLERLLREADLALVLAAKSSPAEADEGWSSLLFQQFHDILPGTSVPEVFEQAEPLWRRARRQARCRRDQALHSWLTAASGSVGPGAALTSAEQQAWTVAQLQPLPGQRRCLRLPAGSWSQADGTPLPTQVAANGGCWLQLPSIAGVAALGLQRRRLSVADRAAADEAGLVHPVHCQSLDAGQWRVGNGLLSVVLGPGGMEQLWDGDGRAYLAAAAGLRCYRDSGEFWDAWDLAADYAAHSRPLHWDAAGWQVLEQGPLCTQLHRRGRCGQSPLRLDVRLLAGTPWLEVWLSVDWRERHALLRFEAPLAQQPQRWASDTSGGILERPAKAVTAREQARWEVAAISWMAAEAAAPGGGLGVLLDGPQGVSVAPEALGVSLLRGPTWPDPGADNGQQRQRLALIPCARGWAAAALPQQAIRFREPLWSRPWPLRPGARSGLPSLGPGLQLLSLRPDPGGLGACLAVQNVTAQRQRLDLSPDWQLCGRLDGLDQPLQTAAQPAEPDAQLLPWQCGFWRIQRVRPAPV